MRNGGCLYVLAVSHHPLAANSVSRERGNRLMLFTCQNMHHRFFNGEYITSFAALRIGVGSQQAFHRIPPMHTALCTEAIAGGDCTTR